MAKDLVETAQMFREMQAVPISQKLELLLSLAEQYGNERLQALYRAKLRMWKGREERAITKWQEHRALTDLLCKPAVELVCGPTYTQEMPDTESEADDE